MIEALTGQLPAKSGLKCNATNCYTIYRVLILYISNYLLHASVPNWRSIQPYLDKYAPGLCISAYWLHVPIDFCRLVAADASAIPRKWLLWLVVTLLLVLLVLPPHHTGWVTSIPATARALKKEGKKLYKPSTGASRITGTRHRHRELKAERAYYRYLEYWVLLGRCAVGAKCHRRLCT